MSAELSIPASDRFCQTDNPLLWWQTGWSPVKDHGLLKCIWHLSTGCRAWLDDVVLHLRPRLYPLGWRFLITLIPDSRVFPLLTRRVSGLGVRLDPSLVLGAGFIVQWTREETCPDQTAASSRTETGEDGNSVGFCPVIMSCWCELKTLWTGIYVSFRWAVAILTCNRKM